MKSYFLNMVNLKYNQRVQLEGENVEFFITSLHNLAESCVR